MGLLPVVAVAVALALSTIWPIRLAGMRHCDNRMLSIGSKPGQIRLGLPNQVYYDNVVNG